MKIEALIKKLTVIKDGDFHLLKFTPEFFHLLEFHPANRTVDNKTYQKHQQKLQVSRSKIGQTQTPTLSIENDKFYIVDGQNRIKGWKEDKNCKSIFCTLSKGDFSETMILSNSNSVNLKKSEYIDHYALKGKNKTHYKILQQILAKAKAEKAKGREIVPALLIGIYSGKPRLQANKDVLSGSFTLTTKNINEARKIVNQIYAMQDAGLKLGIRQSEALYNLILEKKELYNSSLMVRRFKASKNGKTINGLDNVKVILNLLRDIHDGTEVAKRKLEYA